MDVTLRRRLCGLIIQNENSFFYYKVLGCMYTCPHQLTPRDTQHLHRIRQHQQPHPVSPLCLSRMEVHRWEYTCSQVSTHLHTSAVRPPPAAGLRHPICAVTAPGSQPLQLLVPGHVNQGNHSPTLLAQILTHTHVSMYRAD